MKSTPERTGARTLRRAFAPTVLGLLLVLALVTVLWTVSDVRILPTPPVSRIPPSRTDRLPTSRSSANPEPAAVRPREADLSESGIAQGEKRAKELVDQFMEILRSGNYTLLVERAPQLFSELHALESQNSNGVRALLLDLLKNSKHKGERRVALAVLAASSFADKFRADLVSLVESPEIDFDALKTYVIDALACEPVDGEWLPREAEPCQMTVGEFRSGYWKDMVDLVGLGGCLATRDPAAQGVTSLKFMPFFQNYWPRSTEVKQALYSLLRNEDLPRPLPANVLRYLNPNDPEDAAAGTEIAQSMRAVERIGFMDGFLCNAAAHNSAAALMVRKIVTDPAYSEVRAGFLDPYFTMGGSGVLDEAASIYSSARAERRPTATWSEREYIIDGLRSNPNKDRTMEVLGGLLPLETTPSLRSKIVRAFVTDADLNNPRHLDLFVAMIESAELVVPALEAAVGTQSEARDPGRALALIQTRGATAEARSRAQQAHADWLARQRR